MLKYHLSTHPKLPSVYILSLPADNPNQLLSRLGKTSYGNWWVSPDYSGISCYLQKHFNNEFDIELLVAQITKHLGY